MAQNYNISFEVKSPDGVREYRGGISYAEILPLVGYYLGLGFSIHHLTITPAK